MDKNGYNPSILDTEQGTCFICHRQGDTVRHESFFGTANRKNSKECGCWANICPACHLQIHEKPDDGVMDRYLKHATYKAFCRIHGKDAFYEIFGRYYDD